MATANAKLVSNADPTGLGAAGFEASTTRKPNGPSAT
jgi:hypothetical protein